MRPQGPRSLRLSVSFLLLNLTFLAAAPRMYSQSTNNGAVDIGPRNPGTVAAEANCPLTNPPDGPTKFAIPGAACVDIDQPPSTPPQPPADGVGNLIGETTNPNAFIFADQPLSIMWFQALSIFETVASVQGKAGVASEPIVGLGPAFNSNSCFSCHSAPTVGGSSPGSVSITQSNGTQITYNMPLEPAFTGNPELAAAADQGNTFNLNPTFPTEFNSNGPGFANIPVDGPVIEVRVIAGGGSGGFIVQPFGVAELFTIQSRTDAPGCTLAQFPFSSLGNKSISFRIPTPTFGLGLVEATPDQTLVNSLAKNITTTETGSGGSTVQANAAALGIVGTFNRSGNDGTITRFGWKAQNKSLMIFAGEASNVEMGVTNELFPNDKTVAGNATTATTCPPNVLTSSVADQPEDEILPAGFPPTTGDPSVMSSNTQNNAVFMRLNGAPSQCDAVQAALTEPYGTTGVAAVCPAFTTSQVTNGQNLFDAQKTTGCSLCHSPTLVSGPSPNNSLSNQTFHPYSDFAIHDMGPASNGLADGIIQGNATSEFFRTAPLWGLGQRIFFLHDGRAHDLATAIADHCPNPASPGTNESCGSIGLFNGLTKAQQQAILDFLRSL
jgi:CxxC motif-containing protein (DUF1111 family)